jgi:hypothetical protein
MCDIRTNSLCFNTHERTQGLPYTQGWQGSQLRGLRRWKPL